MIHFSNLMIQFNYLVIPSINLMIIGGFKIKNMERICSPCFLETFTWISILEFMISRFEDPHRKTPPSITSSLYFLCLFLHPQPIYRWGLGEFHISIDQHLCQTYQVRYIPPLLATTFTTNPFYSRPIQKQKLLRGTSFLLLEQVSSHCFSVKTRVCE